MEKPRGGWTEPTDHIDN